MGSHGLGGKRMLDTLELGKCVPMQVTDAGSIGERIRKWETRHVKSSLI